jgi:hypothetical protein
MSRLGIALLAILLTMTYPGAASNVNMAPSVFAFSDTISVTVIIDYGNGTVNQYVNANGSNVLEATSSVADVVVTWYGSLAYVAAINGVTSDPTSSVFWQFWVNGNLAAFAANVMGLSSGDTVTWNRTGSQYAGTETQNAEPDLVLLASMMTLPVIGSMFLLLLHSIKKRRVINC